ncbi:hypothetical protein CCYA_CCYA09G2706 [Cyanidiococcus yangmingshanensis]|nr:hypothetical protein CCYA_CCYA09G2706 [Cyanidiococcus yangmingshanensis]
MPCMLLFRECFVQIGSGGLVAGKIHRTGNWRGIACRVKPPRLRRNHERQLSLWSVRQREPHLRNDRALDGSNPTAENLLHAKVNGKQANSETKLGDERPVTNWDRQRTALSVAAGVLVGLIFFGTKGTDRGMEYLAAYFVEQSLSVDNLFVFILLFRFFRVPKHLQEKVLSYGILGAACFRGLFVFAGVALMERFRAISLVFATILLTSSGRILWSALQEAGNDVADEHADMSQNAVVRAVTAVLPVADDYDGNRFFTRLDSGKVVATPLLLVLICVELTDVIFALDSVPACLGISRDPLVVYASNMMAIVGLRSWFFVVQEVIRNFRYIEQTLAAVLGLIGSKLALGFFGYEADATLSLSVILGTLAIGYSAGLVFPGANGNR